MKMPEPIGVVAESRKTISTAFNTTIYTRERFHQGAKVYDKQALIDLLESAAALFPQPHMEYFGREIQDEILKLKEKL